MKSNSILRPLTLALMLGGAALAGCAAQDRSTAQRELPVDQQNSLEVVQLRAQDLHEGMSKAEVFLLLGSPAQYRGDTWVYRNADEEMTVTFRNDRYAGHRGP